MRGAGRIRHPSSKATRRIVGHLLQKYQDPQGIIRHRGRNRTTDQAHFIPSQPSLSLYGPSNIWEFKTDLDTNTTNVWDETNDGAGTGLTVQDELGGFAKVTNNAGDDKYYFYESKYEIARLNATKSLWFRTHIQIGDVDEADMFVGLCARLAAGNLFDNRVDSIGFYLADGSGILQCEASKDGTATQTASTKTITDGATVELGIMVVNDDRVEFWIDDDKAAVVDINTNIPDDTELAFSFGIRNGTGSANTMSVGRTILHQDP
jgi:hypothetical protein